MSTFIVETHEDTWRRAGLDTPDARAPAARRLRRCERRVLRLVVRRGAGGPPAARQQLQVDQLRHRPLPTLVRRERRADRRRGAHGALLDRVGDEAGDGGRGCAGVGVPDARGGPRRRRVPPTRTERRPIVESTQRAAQASLEWFEGLGRYVEQAADAVRVQPADALAAGSPTTTCGCAIPSSFASVAPR